MARRPVEQHVDREEGARAMVAMCTPASVSRAFIRAHAKREKAHALSVPTPKPSKIDSVSTDLSRRLIRRRSTKETKVVVGDSLGRDNVEPSAPASGTSLQGSSNRSVPGSGCTPRGGSKVAPRAPANGDRNVLFYIALLAVLAFAALKAGNWK